MIFHARHIPFFILWVLGICEYMDWLGRQFRIAYTPMENEMKMCTESIRDFSTESENSAPSMKDEYDEYTQKNLTNETRNGEKKISLQISSVIDEREREKLVPQKKRAYFFGEENGISPEDRCTTFIFIIMMLFVRVLFFFCPRRRLCRLCRLCRHRLRHGSEVPFFLHACIFQLFWSCFRLNGNNNDFDVCVEWECGFHVSR